ncbi:hypothetical protein XOCgx_2997 [Xanthomonas oryzae pv. oryzicola]|nr:hypothetical protein XOCgx_2997 [Xanthomonas oryzae pv. oryzicola]
MRYVKKMLQQHRRAVLTNLVEPHAENRVLLAASGYACIA